MPTHILIIEDEAPLREQVVELLELEGYQVNEAENGGMALGLLQNLQPDLIICDIAMPDFDGYQILEHVRQTERLAHVPFIFVTARADRSFVRHGMELGADDYVTKPFTNSELLSAIQSRLKRYQALSASKSGEDLGDAKKKLTRMVAHELRTPLVSMTMIHELISRKVDDLSPDEMRELLSIMQTGNQRLQHLVEQMVYTTQLNTGALDAELVQTNGQVSNIQAIINTGIEMARQFSYRNTNGVIKRVQNPHRVTVHCIPKVLSFAFAEILTNALIFTPENMSVLIDEKIKENHIHVSIIDRGPGLTTGRLKLASIPFEQIDRESQEQQGMGMGLPLAMQIVDIHGGDINVKAIAEGGTRVRIRLPLTN